MTGRRPDEPDSRSAPRWAQGLLRLLAPTGREDELVGDLEEAHRRRLRRQGPLGATLLTILDALDMARALVFERLNPGVSALDFKLGARMLVRYPGLTVLGTLSLTFAIVAGATTFEFLTQVFVPDLDFPEGDRIVGIRLWDSRDLGTERQALWDYGIWQDELTSLDELGAYRTVQRNLSMGEEPGDVVTAAMITASAFRMTGVVPLLGRTLVESDQKVGGPPVVVLGHDVWTDRFASDPDMVGRTVFLGAEPVTVVGVMPEGFAFPTVHGAWLPLRLQTPLEQARPREGPALAFFGRLAPGATKEEARARITALGRTAASLSPETHEHLRPQIVSFAHMALGVPASISTPMMTAWAVSVNLPALLFVVLVCGNVGLLLFARAAIREGEMVVRNALGASRGRILLQLFVEALFLAALAAVVGLALARYTLGWWLHIVEVALLEGPLPFWFEAALSPATITYSVGLTVLAAAVAGVVPGLKVTHAMPTRLQEAAAGSGGFKLGGVWTVVIVCQIALTVVAPVVAVGVHFDSLNERGKVVLPLEDDDFLGARIGLDRDAGANGGGEVSRGGAGEVRAGEGEDDFETGYRRRLETLEELLVADRRVAGVTFSERLPRMYHRWRQIEVDGPAAEPRDERGHRVASSAVALDYFDVTGVEILAGRGFDSGDLDADVGAVVVNESFVRSVLGERNAVGRRIRYVATEEYRDPNQEPGPWMEIVGVVEDLGTTSGYGPMGLYHPADLGEAYPTHVAIHVPGGAEGFGPVLRAAAFQVDPALRIDEVQTFAEIIDSERAFYRFWTFVAGGTAAIALILSLGGIYSVMAFTVTRRTREIGIRVALGSSATRVVLRILRRPLVQVLLGLAAGGGLLMVPIVAGNALFDVRVVGFFAGYMVLMAVVCLTAAVVPTRRALAVEPAEALRGEE